MNYLLGIDLGTTSLKVSLYQEDGTLLKAESQEYTIQVPEPGYAEQNPEDWWNALVSCCQKLKAVLPAAFAGAAGIGICGQMHTQVYLDAQDRVLRPAITWLDQRSAGIVEEINQNPEIKALIYQETANAASTTYTAPQLLWVKQNQPQVWEKVRSVLVAKDYIKFLLTGVKSTDYAEASGTLLFDVRKEKWSDAVIAAFEIPKSLLPEIGPSDIMIGQVHAAAAQATGLRQGTPVINGSSDNSASALGAGMTRPGQVTLIIGTAGVITVCSDHPLSDPKHRTSCWHYCLRNHWATLGIMQTAGESLQWFRNTFDAGEDLRSSDIFNQYNQTIAGVPEGSNGLIFLPYLNGERTPYWDPNARGVFFGINLATEKAHFIKAIMEGVSFGLRNNIETVESLGIQINEVRAVGGGLKSPVWLETLAKIIRKPVVTIGNLDTANLGNIVLCGNAIGLYSDYDATLKRMVETGEPIFYPEGTAVYEKQYPLFLELYEDLKPTFQKAQS